jgi:hypothetical protein
VEKWKSGKVEEVEQVEKVEGTEVPMLESAPGVSRSTGPLIDLITRLLSLFPLFHFSTFPLFHL